MVADHDLLVDPVGAGVHEVGLHARPRREAAALHHIGLDQRPRTVADHGDRLARLGEALHEGDGIVVGAERVGVGYAAGQHQPVEVGRGDLADDIVHRERVRLVEVVEALHLTGVDRHELRRAAGLLHRLPGFGELDLLHTLGGEEGDRLSLEFVSHARDLPA